VSKLRTLLQQVKRLDLAKRAQRPYAHLSNEELELALETELASPTLASARLQRGASESEYDRVEDEHLVAALRVLAEHGVELAPELADLLVEPAASPEEAEPWN
jgi:hypothetical protein